MTDPAGPGLARRASPLEPLGENLRAASSDRVTLRALEDVAQLSLRGDPDDRTFRDAVRSVLGFDVPIAPNTFAGAPPLAAYWLGPDEWLVTGAPGSETTLAERLARALGACHAAVVDVTASRAVLALEGPASPAVLMKGCALDLHPRAFAPGRCAQTLLARAGVLIALLDDPPSWRVFVRRSFAAYLALWLVDAMREFGGAANR
jgi:sarcosine oxidase subunit gamma